MDQTDLVAEEVCSRIITPSIFLAELISMLEMYMAVTLFVVWAKHIPRLGPCVVDAMSE